jgi:hypothetical protein
MELRIFLEEWLVRIPDFQIAPGKKPRTIGSINNGMMYLPLSWSVWAGGLPLRGCNDIPAPFRVRL